MVGHTRTHTQVDTACDNNDMDFAILSISFMYACGEHHHRCRRQPLNLLENAE